MFIDASALCALLTDEDGARELLARMKRGQRRSTSPTAVWETAISVARILDLPIPEAADAVDDYLALMSIEVVAIPPEAAHIAIDAFARYGKGNHPARLNFGDCFAYACARHHREPLLYEGSDFAQTDIDPA